MDALAQQQAQMNPKLIAQRYSRASPSFSGTARTVDSGATAGHGSSSTARPRELPLAPADETNRLMSASGMEADAIVDSYGAPDSAGIRASAVSTHNLCDARTEDDRETVQDHETLVVPTHITVGEEASPNGDTIWRGSQYEDQRPRSELPQRSSSLSDSGMTQSDSGVGMSSPERPRMYYKGHPSQEVMPEDGRGGPIMAEPVDEAPAVPSKA